MEIPSVSQSRLFASVCGFSSPPQRAEPFHNYTGCIQLIELNNLRNFHASDAISGSNIGQCRWSLWWCFTSLSCGIITVKFHGFRIKYLSIYRYAMVDSATNTLDLTTQSPTIDTAHTAGAPVAGPVQTQKHPAGGLEVCEEGVCGNGGTCHRLPGEALPSCHCPLHFTGAFCEKGEPWTFFNVWAVRLFQLSGLILIYRRRPSGEKLQRKPDQCCAIVKSLPTNYVS